MLRLSTLKVEPSRKPSPSPSAAMTGAARTSVRDAAQAGFFLLKRMDSFLLLEHDDHPEDRSGPRTGKAVPRPAVIARRVVRGFRWIGRDWRGCRRAWRISRGGCKPAVGIVDPFSTSGRSCRPSSRSCSCSALGPAGHDEAVTGPARILPLPPQVFPP